MYIGLSTHLSTSDNSHESNTHWGLLLAVSVATSTAVRNIRSTVLDFDLVEIWINNARVDSSVLNSLHQRGRLDKLEFKFLSLEAVRFNATFFGMKCVLHWQAVKEVKSTAKNLGNKPKFSNMLQNFNPKTALHIHKPQIIFILKEFKIIFLI